MLFNLDKARAAIRQHNFALLVEGQMDCISVFMTGVQNVLATSGTAFTEHQVNLLKRYCTQVVVNFDPDTAGANAAEKSIALLTEEGFTVKVITLEDGLDPDRYIRERGAAAYHAAARVGSGSARLPDRARPPALPAAQPGGQGQGAELSCCRTFAAFPTGWPATSSRPMPRKSCRSIRR